MINFLRIKDFALIKSLELELGDGLTVITGETGAGKSIILAAVGLLLGERAASDLIRGGADNAVVEALFSLDPESPAAKRLRSDLDGGLDGGELVVKRVVKRQGSNRVQLNGSLATLAALSQVGPEMVNLCGQHSHQLLLRPEEHLNLLDAFGKAEPLAAKTREAMARIRRIDNEMDELRQTLAKRDQRRDYLELVIQELEKAELDQEEEDQLKKEARLLANAEKIAGLAGGAVSGLYTADNGSALEILGKVRTLLDDLGRLDDSTAHLAKQVEEAYYLIEDAAASLQDYSSRRSFDPGRLDFVQRRLNQIHRITRKYGGDVASALEFLADARTELNNLDHGREQLQELEIKRQQAEEHALNIAQKLSAKRRKAAVSLAKAVAAELAPLGMPACRFKVEFTPPASGAVKTAQGPLSSRGLEQAAFHIAPNPGEGFKPLVRIASGGELSRILLALQTLVAYRRGAPALIFDEVDAGVGGAVGAAVGRKMAELAKGGQVVCITHLPQIAAWGKQHLSVRKKVVKGRTTTVLTPLDHESRIDELARMLAGPEGGEAAKEHAISMLDGAMRQSSGD
jgi:DNA repair protein RecN (Recombination protein N)